MNVTEHTYFLDEHFNMQGIDLQSIIASRLEDMADQVDQLFVNGYPEEAKLLRAEGLELAATFDSGAEFLFLEDMTQVR